jgi:hypothetical protein
MTVVMAASGLLGSGLGTGPASAEAGNGAMVPLGRIYRACDFAPSDYVPGTGTTSGTAVVGTGGTNTVTADVSVMIATPNTPYQVRLIQGPRPGSQKCIAGDPGVASAVLNTDGNGVGRVTLHAPLRSGATNAWVFVEGPPTQGRIFGDFYTSDILTSLE